MTKPWIDWDVVRELAVGLPPACRTRPPDHEAYKAYIAPMLTTARAREVAELWRLLNDLAPGATIEDAIEVLDHPEATDDQLAAAKPFAEVFPDLATTMRKGRGKQKAPTKVPVSIRLDQDVLNHFKKSGRGWQARMSDALRKASGL